MLDFLNYINGQFSGALNQKFVPVISKFDPQVSLGRCAVSEPLDFVMAVRTTKLAHAELQKQNLSSRIQMVSQILNLLEKQIPELAKMEANFQGLSQLFIQEKVLKPWMNFAKDKLQNHWNQEPVNSDSLEITSSGVILISPENIFSLKSVLERLLPALVAGNSVVIRLPFEAAYVANVLGEILNQASLPQGLVQMLIGDDELFEMMAQHPAIAGVSFVGGNVNSTGLLSKLAQDFKKVQFQGSSKNAVIMLSDFDFENKIADLMQPFLMGMGRSLWNGSRLFVLESQREAFLTRLKSYLQELKPAHNSESQNCWWPVSETEKNNLNQYLLELPSEHGKTLLGDNKSQVIEFTLDLTNCSTKQQDPLSAPLFILSSVKYQHEFAKWVNTSYLGHSAVIFGSEEKARKVAAQLEVGLVQLNGWSVVAGEQIFGTKNSVAGLLDLQPQGHFFSNIKKLTLQ